MWLWPLRDTPFCLTHKESMQEPFPDCGPTLPNISRVQWWVITGRATESRCYRKHTCHLKTAEIPGSYVNLKTPRKLVWILPNLYCPWPCDMCTGVYPAPTPTTIAYLKDACSHPFFLGIKTNSVWWFLPPFLMSHSIACNPRQNQQTKEDNLMNLFYFSAGNGTQGLGYVYRSSTTEPCPSQLPS